MSLFHYRNKTLNEAKGYKLGKCKRAVIFCVSILVLLLVLWLLFSNHIMGRLSGNCIPQGVTFDQFERNTAVKCAIDGSEFVGGVFDTTYIHGWAFIETEEENNARTTSLVLKNSKKSYEVLLPPPTDSRKGENTFARRDVKQAYSDLNINPDSAIGISHNLSTYNIQAGTYDVYIYCWENETDHGLVHTGKQFVKDSSGCVFRSWQSTEASLENHPSEETALRALDTITLENDLLTATGWIYQPELDCANQSVYFEINGTAYTALSVARPDVAKGYENELYTMSGYRACIPAEVVPEGESTVRVLVENGGQVYSGAPITVVRTGDTVEKKS